MPPKVPAHVFTFSLALTPAIGYALYYYRNGPSEEKLEETLNETYAAQIESSRAKRNDIMKIIQSGTDPDKTSPDMESKFQQALYGGRSSAKKHSSIDERLYGKEEGQILKQKFLEQQREEKEKERKLKNKKKKKKTRKKKDQEQQQQQQDGESVVMDTMTDTTSVSSYAASLGVFAAIVGVFLMSGKRN